MAILTAIFLIAAAAGFIDAIAGGGGLILLPALIFAGLPAPVAVATNKLFNVCSSFASATRFYRLGEISWRHFKSTILFALCGSIVGSYLIGLLSRNIAEPLIAGLLVIVAVIVLVKKDFGTIDRSHLKVNLVKLCTAVGLIGIHDGFFGPGAGIFLVFSLIHYGNCSFLKATGTAKVINLSTSLVALTVFIGQGLVNWKFGLAGSAGVLIGSYFGAGFAGRLGVRVIRPTFVCIALAIFFKILC